MASWGVAALADEPGILIAAFAAHYLDLGASEVRIMLDRPNPEARELLSGVPGAILTDAGEDGWTFRGGFAPKRHLTRQKYHASKVLAETQLDAILHCDIDEFLLPLRRWPRPWPAARVSRVLDRMPLEADWMKIEVAERVWLQGGPEGLFDGPFRRVWHDFSRDGAQIYDEAARMQLNWGVCGHHMGKGITRSGRGLFAGIHQPMRDYKGTGRDLNRAETRRLLLLHYDGLTPLHYALKMVRRALAAQGASPPPHGEHRRLQFEALAGAGGDTEAILAQWKAAKTIDTRQGNWLKKKNLLSDFSLGAEASMRHILGHVPDLSPAAFDRALLDREGGLIARAEKAFGFDPSGLVSR